MSIRDWPKDDRPREKLMAKGAAQLSDAELLAIFLRVGMKGKSAVQLAQELLRHFGSLSALAAAQKADFVKVPGMGPAKYVQFKAAFELARALSSPGAVRDYLRLQFHGLQHEVFVVVFLDAQHRVVANEEMFRGTLTQTSVYPREIVKKALQINAAAVILAHNHPSGVAEPSGADEALTRALREALALVDVRVLDHFVVGAGAAVSFAERGLL